MLQSTDPQKLSNKEGAREETWISLGRGNRIDIAGGWVVGNGNMRDRVRGG